MRERQRQRGRERGRRRIRSRLCSVSAEPDGGLKLTNGEIMTWAKIKSQLLNWLGHPGAPKVILTIVIKLYNKTSPTWQHRRLLDFSPLTDPPNVQLHMEQLPLREIQEWVEWLLHTGQWRKYLRWNEMERLRHSLTINPNHAHHAILREPLTFSFSLRSKGFGTYNECPKFQVGHPEDANQITYLW